MDYQRIYNSLIANAILRKNIDGYKESHHIKPKSIGGTDDYWNLVKLTAREHFIAHVLLAKIHGGNLWFAVLAMAGGANRKELYAKGRMYELAKKENSKVRSQNMTGVIVPINVRAKIKKSLMGNTNASGLRTIEARKNISNSLVGRKLSISHVAKVRLNAIGNKSMTGQSHSEETSALIPRTTFAISSLKDYFSFTCTTSVELIQRVYSLSICRSPPLQGICMRRCPTGCT